MKIKRKTVITGKAGTSPIRKPKRIRRTSESVRAAVAEAASPAAQPEPTKAPWWVYD